MTGNPFNPPESVVAPNGAVVATAQYPKIKAWSYSVVQQHELCPLSVRFRKIDRYPEPDNPAISRGKTIHDELAHLIRTGEFPEHTIIPHREEWRRRLLHLHVGGAQAELQHAFDRQWRTVPWFGANVWGRVIIDGILAKDDYVVIHEHKTGRVYPQHEQQERLYGLCALKMYPGITYAVVQCNYIDIPTRADKLVKFTRNQEQDLENEFTDFAAPLLNETLYPASPGGHCSRCHFRKSNAGPCAFG